MKSGLGKLERLFLAYLQMRGLTTVRTGDLIGALRLSAKSERELLSRLCRAGLIARVRRGLYLAPARLPLGGAWTPDEALAIDALMAASNGRYQICGPNAFNRYGFDNQIPNRVYVYNNRLSGERTIGKAALTLIKVRDDRLGDTDEALTAEGRKAIYSSRTRTLVDAVYDWARFNSLPRGFDWIRRELGAGRVDSEQLAESAFRYGDTGTRRRIGALLEAEGAPERQLRKLERTLGRSSSLIPFNPVKAKRGKVSGRWGVVLNETT